MIRSFRVRDALLLWRLQPGVVRLDQPEAAIRPWLCLWMALLDYPLPTGLGARTFVKDRGDDHGPPGFLQALPRPGRPEWEIIALAPHPEAQENAAMTWEGLTGYVSRVAAQAGDLRVFARADRDSPERGVLGQCGFVGYAYERIWRAGEATGEPSEPAAIRPRRAEDDWSLHQLYLRATPPDVQAAEGHLNLGPRAKFNLGLGHGYREYVWQGGERPSAHLAVAQGPRGHVLRVVADPEKPHAGKGLLSWALARLAGQANKPIYGVTRHYDTETGHWLAEHGFTPLGDQALMVKHLAVRVKEPVLRLEPSLEHRVNRATTPTCVEYEPEQA